MIVDASQNTVQTFEQITEIATNQYRKFFDSQY